MRKRTHIFSLLLCLLVFISSSVTVFAQDAAAADDDLLSQEDVSQADDTQSQEVSLFTIDESQPRVFTQGDTQYTLYPAALTIDIDNDGKCNAADARALLRISAELDIYDGDVADIDISGDGVITASDARAVLRYSAMLDNYYFTVDGTSPEGFITDENDNVFYISGSIMSIGLTTVGSNVYYFDSATGMSTGLIKIGSSVYYFGSDGKGVSSKTEVDGKKYYFENGKAKVGFVTESGNLYYYGSDGVMVTGLTTIDGSTYYFGSDGKAYSGKTTLDGKTYNFENGKAKTGLCSESGSYYYYGKDGVMVTGTSMKIDGIYYNFDANGKGTKGKDPSTYKIAMIGDSLVANIGSQDVTDRIDFYGKVSLNARTIFTKSISGSSRYVIDEIKDRDYDVVVVLVGINDVGNSDSSYTTQYTAIIQGVKERAPGAIIYAHAILPINDSVAKKSGYTCTNAQIKNKNSIIKSIAESEGVNYIDAAEVLADSSGSLPSNAATDGIHIGKAYCKTWSDWLVKTICQ